jgi:predicted ester cyclase
MATRTTTKTRTATKKQSAETAEVARSYFEAIGRKDLDAMEAHYKPGPVGRIHGMVELVTGPGGNYREWFSSIFAAFPDFNFELLDVIAEGDKAAVRYRLTGTFNGTARFEGMEPNGASVSVEGCDVVTVEEGLLVDNQAYLNGVEIGRQLGALPPEGSLPERGMTAALNLKTRVEKALRR